ncbi:MAG TPA: ATP-binding protein [Acetobacteraceae bacterium]|nr:ATP-binding protein [Acetobacteraceae bacterium]
MSALPASSDDLAARHPLQREIRELKGRLAEAEETLQAIRQGEVDAVIVKGASGPQVYTLLNADRPYRNFVERMQEGALTLTPDGTVLYANQRLATFLGLALPNIVGQDFARFVTADDRDRFNELMTEGARAGGSGELRLRAGDDTAVPVYLSVVDLLDEGQRIISGIVTDVRWQKQRIAELAQVNARLVAVIAERERAEAMLRQAQKMEAVGQLTAGIAHDFNNLLLVIAGNLELFEARTRDEWLKARVEASRRAVERGARLTQQLLAFARHQDLRPHPISVNALLRDMDPLLRSSLGDGIRLALVLGEELEPCLVDATELQAAILNLATNARDAMPDGGSLTIATEDAELACQPDDGAGPIRGGRYLSVVVTDTGLGMSPEIRERAFDPFFTTKEVGKGTGLGLSRIYGFMRQSGGQATIESAPGAGTSVRLYLPRTAAPGVAPAPPAADRMPRRASQALRVLVVDDDRDVRELVVEVLEGLGYAAIAADSGPGALSLLDGGVAVDVVLSDVLMPDGMSGFDLAREIRHRRPRLAIVLTSGMTALSGVAVDATQDLPILRKPYRCDDLSRAIEAALEAAAL